MTDGEVANDWDESVFDDTGDGADDFLDYDYMGDMGWGASSAMQLLNRQIAVSEFLVFWNSMMGTNVGSMMCSR